MTSRPAGPSWTILIPTIGQRDAMFRRLMGVLLPQTEMFAGRVKVRAWWNNGEPSLAEIRQGLVESVTTDYLSFIDDDDMIPDDFVRRVMHALRSRPDYVGWQVRYLSGGQDRGLIDHSLRHGGWREEKKPVYRLLRDISHINPMRADVAKKADFRGVRAGRPEDWPWVDQVRATGSLVNEVYIPAPMYEYRWDKRVSAWRQPNRIRKGYQRPVIEHDNFSWHDPNAPKDLGRLAVIVPTRGRPENIRKVIAAWDDTKARECADLILAVDRDDPTYPEYCEIAEDRATICVSDRWVHMVTKLNATAVSVARNEKYSAIAFAGDDHLPRTVGWARAYLAALAEMGTGMVYGDDGYQGRKLSTEWAVTANAVRALGAMVPAPVQHLYCDNAMMDLFGQVGALRHLADVRIEHMHPVAGKAESDEQYRRVNGREQYANDRAAYQNWRRSSLPAQVATIRALMPAETAKTTARPQRVPNERRTKMSMSMPKKIERSGPSRKRGINAPPKSRFPFPPEFRYVIGATPDEIAFTLADFAKNVPADQEIVELGVYQARTALIMAWGAAQGDGAHVTAIDPWDLAGNVYDPPFTQTETRQAAHDNVHRLGYADRVRLINDFSHDMARVWDPIIQDKPVGLLFVDGDHTYEGARRDIELWAPHLAPDAVIAVDDYGHPDWPGVAQAVDKLVDEGFLKPVEIYHERLAVTRLTGMISTMSQFQAQFPESITAITSEGVEPAPVPEPEPIISTVRGGLQYPRHPVEVIEPEPDVSRSREAMREELLGKDLHDLRQRAKALGVTRAGVMGAEKLVDEIMDRTPAP